MEDQYLFKVKTPLGVEISITSQYWHYIVTVKHRLMHNKENLVKEIIKYPDEIRQSKSDESVYLYYKQTDKLYCVVCKHVDKEGFIITTYPTDRVKEGNMIWKK